MGSPPPGAFAGGQLGVQDFNGVEIAVKPWNASVCNLANSPLLAPDTGVGEAPQNDATVEDNSTPPQIEATVQITLSRMWTILWTRRKWMLRAQAEQFLSAKSRWRKAKITRSQTTSRQRTIQT